MATTKRTTVTASRDSLATLENEAARRGVSLSALLAEAVDEKAAGITAAVFAAALAYFWFYSRHHLVARAPEEEFAAIAEAESKLH